MTDIVERLGTSSTWSLAEASETGRLMPQRVLDQWDAERKEAAAEITRLRAEVKALQEKLDEAEDSLDVAAERLAGDDW